MKAIRWFIVLNESPQILSRPFSSQKQAEAAAKDYKLIGFKEVKIIKLHVGP